MASSISHSFRLLTAKIPIPLQRTKPLSRSSILPSFVISKSITFQTIDTKQSRSPVSVSASNSTSSLQPIEELPPKLQEIIKLFQSVQEPKAKYEQLLFYGKNLKPLDAQFKTKENKVQGCVSQVWVRAYLDDERNVLFDADSDSVLTKGLAALLVQGLSGRPVEEIVRVSPDFAVLLGLNQSLTPSRNNGFLNMLKLMQKKAIELYVQAEKGIESSQSSNLDEESSVEAGNVQTNGDDLIINGVDDDSELNANAKEPEVGGLGSRGLRIKEKLEEELRPVLLEVEDVSYQHAGHAGVRGSDGETHFNVKVVSKDFEGKSLVKRHRLIYGLLQEELQSGLHALSIVAKTPAEI
ncbi:SufE-like protein 1, chloroplastic/mitochondrial [Linum grandiflorum]